MFVKVTKALVRDGIRLVAGAIRLVIGPGRDDSVRTTNSFGEVVDLYPGEYEEIKRKDQRDGR